MITEACEGRSNDDRQAASRPVHNHCCKQQATIAQSSAACVRRMAPPRAFRKRRCGRSPVAGPSRSSVGSGLSRSRKRQQHTVHRAGGNHDQCLAGERGRVERDRSTWCHHWQRYPGQSRRGDDRRRSGPVRWDHPVQRQCACNHCDHDRCLCRTDWRARKRGRQHDRRDRNIDHDGSAKWDHDGQQHGWSDGAGRWFPCLDQYIDPDARRHEWSYQSRPDLDGRGQPDHILGRLDSNALARLLRRVGSEWGHHHAHQRRDRHDNGRAEYRWAGRQPWLDRNGRWQPDQRNRDHGQHFRPSCERCARRTRRHGHPEGQHDRLKQYRQCRHRPFLSSKGTLGRHSEPQRRDDKRKRTTRGRGLHPGCHLNRDDRELDSDGCRQPSPRRLHLQWRPGNSHRQHVPVTEQ